METIEIIETVGKIVGVVGIPIGIFEVYKFFINRKKEIKEKLNDNLYNNYLNIIKSKDFILWRDKLLCKVYDDQQLVELFGHKYPAVTYKLSNSNDRIIFDNTRIKLVDDIEKLVSSTIDKETSLNTIQKDFLKTLNKTIKRPNDIGYCLDELILDKDNNLIRYTANICTFKQNLISSFILEYELAQFYKNSKSSKTNEVQSILKKLQIRRNIHEKSINTKQILTTGIERKSELSVQTFVLFKDSYSGKYKTLLIERSDDVSYGPGLYQFIPCGYFEMYEVSKKKWNIEKNFDSSLTAFREYLEEIFGKDEFIENKNGDSVENLIFKNIQIEKILMGINNNSVHYDFLGSIIDLVTLTHTLSYLLIIDDKDFFKGTKFESNHESFNFEEVEIKEIEHLVDGGFFMPESAGLFDLAINHPKVQKRII